MSVSFLLRKQPLDFILRFLAMTGIKLLVSAHLVLRKRSIYVSSNHYPRKISAVQTPKIEVSEDIAFASLPI